jgi:hypothetical protein
MAGRRADEANHPSEVLIMKFWKWLAGHWLWVAVIGIAALTVILVFAGKLTPQTSAGLGLVIVTALAADFRPQLERHQKEVLLALTEIAAAGNAFRAHNMPAALQAGEAAVEDGALVAQEVKAGTQ